MTKENKNITGIITSIVFISSMVFISELLGSKEIIFPEISAICLGAFVAPNLAWNTSKPRMLICISICAVLGYLISAFLPVHLYIKLLVAFILGTTVLILSKTGFVPMLSAIILPVVLKTDNIVYPISAVILTLSVVILLLIFEKTGIRNKREFICQKFDFKNDYMVLIKRFLVYAVLALVSVMCDCLLICAPPLVVAFTELSNTESKARNIPVRIYVLMVVSAFTGELIRFLLCTQLKLPLFVGTVLAITVVLIVLNIAKVYMPPILAITTLAFLAKPQFPFYTLQISIGFGLLLLCAIKFFSEKKCNNLRKYF